MPSDRGAGVRFVAKSTDTPSADGKLVLLIFGALAVHERALIGERVPAWRPRGDEVTMSVVPDKDAAETIAEYVTGQAGSNMINVNLDIACESKAGVFETSSHIERQPRDIGAIMR